jgi:hypothetical protein
MSKADSRENRDSFKIADFGDRSGTLLSEKLCAG